eukprot:7186552-Alexandrium_andersonii.AAC.1
MPERNKMCLGHSFLVNPDAFCFDIGQSIGRAPHGKAGVFPTLLPGSFIWDMRLHRPLLGIESLMLQGFPKE